MDHETAVITLVEALNYRCLRYIRQRLKAFQVMVGASADRNIHCAGLGGIARPIALGIRNILRTSHETNLHRRSKSDRRTQTTPGIRL